MIRAYAPPENPTPFKPDASRRGSAKELDIATSDPVSASSSRILGGYHAVTAATALTAALATFASVALALPAWAMFMGWVACDTRGQSVPDRVANLACFFAGVAFGIAAAHAITALTPTLGSATAGVAMFGLAMIVVSLRAVPVLNNILSYFLGVISFFAAQMEPTLTSFIVLASAGTLGCLAGWVASTAQNRLSRAG